MQVSVTDLKRKTRKALVGVDEVGRGALAGPVSVGIFIAFDEEEVKSRLAGIRDSKKLTRKERENWTEKVFILCKEGKAAFIVSSSSHRIIDQKGINHAVYKAICSCLTRSAVSHDSTILLDGLLRAPSRFRDQKTIVGGDDKELVISAASVVAKVARDRVMRKLASKYGGYGFETNVGYGTSEHREALKRTGLTNIHRKTYCTRILDTT